MNKGKRKEQTVLILTWKQKSKITGIRKYFSIITLNVSNLNSPIKRHLLADWIKKQDQVRHWWLTPIILASQEAEIRRRNLTSDEIEAVIVPNKEKCWAGWPLC
jgi:hypothetical protein